ncbi:MAG: acyltransferase family protein [Flavobacteriaceae bacterium]
MTNQGAVQRIPNLTAIRFLLALLVILFHVPQFSKNRGFPFLDDLSIFQKGTEAVWMFFSLSGFLIIKQLYNEKKYTNFIDIKAFYRRRILRILPLYYLVVTVGFLYYRMILPRLGFEFQSQYDLVSGLLLSLTFFANIFSTYSPGGILEILWSIAIEEQFYLFIAPLCFVLKPKQITWFLGLFTGLYFMLYFSDYFSGLRAYNMLFFFFSFGGLCAILSDKSWFYNGIQKGRHVLIIAVIIFFTTSIFKDKLITSYYTLCSVILFGIFLAAIAQQPIRWLEHKTLDYLGKISYGIYMYHAICLQFVGLLFLKIISKLGLNDLTNVLIINILVIIFTVILSHFSYQYFELYFLNKKRKT